MKCFNDLKLRSKLPSFVKSAARQSELHQYGKFDDFNVEQVELNELRFVWWIRDPETSVRTITDIIQFEIDPVLAKQIMQKNNPEGAI